MFEDQPAVLQRDDYECWACVGAWIARCFGYSIEVEDLKLWTSARRRRLVPAFGDVQGGLDQELAAWFRENAFEVGLVRVPWSPDYKLDAPGELDRVWKVVDGLTTGAAGVCLFYTCRGIVDPRGLHLRALNWSRIMCPRLGLLPLTKENFFRLPDPGPVRQSWDLWWVMGGA